MGAHSPERACLLCGSTENLTVEHILPQALLRRFKIAPNHQDLADFRTTLCERHNRATASLHERGEMLDLIETGAPVTRKTLAHLGDWAVWVTLLLGLARGSGVLDADVSRKRLLQRFDSKGTGRMPRGIRVYAARIAAHVDPREPAAARFSLALREDSRIVLDANRAHPIGYDVRSGSIKASESIGLGKLALLVVGQSFSSGEGHKERLDEAAASVGLDRISPLGPALPRLEPIEVSMRDVGNLFTVIPFGSDMSLLPAVLRALTGSTDTDSGP